MSTDDDTELDDLHLRAMAEALLANAPQTDARPAAEVLHELQVHQIELEMQNEALRQTQTTLEEARDRYHNLYEFAPVGHLSLTADGLIQEINLTGIRMLGAERKKLLQKRITAWVIPQDQDRWTQFFLNVIRADEVGRVELALQRDDGTVLQAQLDCERTMVGAGDTAIRVALTDISERKRSQDALDKFFDQSTNLHLIAQLDGIIRRTNRGCEITLGYGKEELKGSNFLDLVHPDDKARTLAEMAKLAQGITTLRFENRYRHKNGEFRRLAWSANIDAENRLIYAIASDITDQRRAEEELKRQSQRLLLATSSAELGVWDWNVSENRMEWDERMFELYGITRESSPDNIDLWMKGLHPEGRERAMAECQAALAGEKAFDTVFRVLHPDGTVKHLKANGLVIRGADGTAERMIGVNADITERRQAEDTLRESEERWKFALEGAGDGVWDWNIQTGEALYTGRWKEMWGFAESEIGNNAAEWTTRVHPEELPGVMTTIQAHIDGKTPSAVVEFRMLCKDGSWRWTLGRGMVVSRDASGKPIRLIGTNTDITERKRAEESLRLSEERYRFSLEVTGQMGWSCMPDGQVEDAPMWRNYTGQSLQEAAGWKWLDAIHPEDRESANQAVSMAVAQKCNYSTEYRLRRADGVYRNFMVRGIQLFNADGSCKEWVGTCIDITERKQTETELERHRHHLQELVEERTAELARAKEGAETANIAKSAFLANMSHEIRTPMNGIIGMANILRREGLTSRQAKRFDTIDASAQHLLSVINDILDISKIEAGKLELEAAPVVISSLLANVSSILSERAKAKGIHLLIQTEFLPSNLVGDPVRLQQALLNYASNAIKFSEKGTVTLRALKEEETTGEVVVRFEIQDNGIGIAPETLSRLFSAFEQADNSMTRKYGGTGLGLAITRRLAELMGGDAGADSTAGAGSTFWFTVRLKKGAALVVTQAATGADAETLIRQLYASRRILVVDDEPINREVVQMQLEAVDLVVDMAEDGAEAVTLAQERSYAAIFMDMQMPKVTGVEATRLIRQLPGYGDTPIIAMTANVFTKDKAECLAAGMNDFLIKPFNPDEMFAVLLRALSRRDS